MNLPPLPTRNPGMDMPPLPTRNPGMQQQQQGFFGGNGGGMNMGLILGGIAGMSGANPAQYFGMGKSFDDERRKRAMRSSFMKALEDPELASAIPQSVKAMLPYMEPEAAARTVSQFQLKMQAQRQRTNQFDEREKAALRFGLKPGSREFQVYNLTGRLPDTVASGAGQAQQLGYKDLNQLNQAEASLRKEVAAQTKDFGTVRMFQEQLKDAPNNGAGALNMVFGFMKILDPGSVVRPSEQASVENAGGVPERIRGIYNRALRGGMDEKLMQQFKAEAARIVKERERRYMQTYQRYLGIAKRRQMDPRNVLPPLDGQATENAGPRVFSKDKPLLDPLGIR